MAETCLEVVLSLHSWLKFFSIEREAVATNSELRRWFKQGAVEVNGVKVKADTPWPVPVTSLVLFPNGNRKTTLA